MSLLINPAKRDWCVNSILSWGSKTINGFTIAAAAVGGNLNVLNCEPGHLEIIINLLKDAGCSISIGNNFVKISSPEKIKAVERETLELLLKNGIEGRRT